MLTPTTNWGTKFLSMPLQNDQQGENFYLAVTDTDKTFIELTNSTVIAINKGESTLFSASSGMITSNFPISIAQIGHSDPFFLPLAPINYMTSQNSLLVPTSPEVLDSSIPIQLVHTLRIFTHQKFASDFILNGKNLDGSQFGQVAKTGYWFYEKHLNGDEMFEISSQNAGRYLVRNFVLCAFSF